MGLQLGREAAEWKMSWGPLGGSPHECRGCLASLRPGPSRPARRRAPFSTRPLPPALRAQAAPSDLPLCEKRLSRFLPQTHTPQLTSQPHRPGVLNTGRWVAAWRPFGVFAAPRAAASNPCLLNTEAPGLRSPAQRDSGATPSSKGLEGQVRRRFRSSSAGVRF